MGKQYDGEDIKMTATLIMANMAQRVVQIDPPEMARLAVRLAKALYDEINADAEIDKTC